MPKIYEEILKIEVDTLENMGILKRKNNSEWTAPIFSFLKRNGTVCFFSDFREYNKRIYFTFQKYMMYFQIEKVSNTHLI